MSNTASQDPNKKIHWRYLVFVGILLLMFGYLASGLVRLQLQQSEEYAEKAESVRTNFIQYGLRFPELVRADLSRLPLKLSNK